jgi:hypothetical protein
VIEKDCITVDGRPSTPAAQGGDIDPNGDVVDVLQRLARGICRGSATDEAEQLEGVCRMLETAPERGWFYV